MNFFTKSLDSINFQDVIDLVDKKYRESIFLDYKSGLNLKDLSSEEVVKDVSAFANSEGGWLVYGVKTDKNDQYPEEIDGVSDPIALQDRIIQCCSDPTNLNPPIFVDPKILIDQYKNQEKAVVVVRIDRSLNTPHFIKDFTNFYIRVADKCRPMFGSPAILALLQNRRQKMQELKNLALQESQEMAIYHLVKEANNGKFVAPPPYPCPFLHLSVIPEVFVDKFFDVSEIGKIIEEVKKGLYAKFNNSEDRFYNFFGRPIETISSGVVYRHERYPFLDDRPEPNVIFNQANITGLLSHLEDMSFRYNAPDDKGVTRKQYAIIPFDILRTMIGFLSFVSDFYLLKDINVTLNFRAEFFQIRDMLVMRYNRHIPDRWVVENHFIIEKQLTLNKDFAKAVHEFVFEKISHNLLRGVNFSYNENLALDEIKHIMTPFKK